MSNPVLPAFETLLKDAERTSNQSQIPYRLLFDANPIPMWMVDLTTFRFLAVNDAATCQYGYSSEEFLRMSIADIQPDAHIPDIKEMVAKWCPGIQSPGIRKHRRKDGSTIDVEIVCHDFEFQESKAILCAAYDITERQLSRDMLRDSETKYRALFEHSPEFRSLLGGYKRYG